MFSSVFITIIHLSLLLNEIIGVCCIRRFSDSLKSSVHITITPHLRLFVHVQRCLYYPVDPYPPLSDSCSKLSSSVISGNATRCTTNCASFLPLSTEIGRFPILSTIIPILL